MPGSGLARLPGRRLRPALPSSLRKVNPFRIHQYQHGLIETVPDIIEFIVSDKYLDRPNLYPRQATFLKVMFLQKELLTQYDYDVIGEWETNFLETGNEGISPGILDRIDLNRAAGRKWFRETQAVIGRRGSKGFIGGLAGSFVTWNFMMVPGGPQAHYGIDRDKRLTGIVFAGKKEQARDNLWRDWFNVMTGAPCFSPYISRPQAERLTIFAPTDVLKQERLESMGVLSENDLASIEIIPAPSTTMAARGPAMYCEMFDEQAHVISSTAVADAEQVYDCLDPSTRVLMADLTWKPIGEVQVGDHVVAVDEQVPGHRGHARKMREATILGRGEKVKKSYRVVFDDGTSVTCSAQHRWLRVGGKDKNSKWASIDKPAGGPNRWSCLQVGDRVRTVVDAPVGKEHTFEAGYVSGLLDGEGHIGFRDRGSMRLGFTQNPGPVLDAYRDALLSRGIGFTERLAAQSNCHIITIEGFRDSVEVLTRFAPQRLLNNARHLWQGRAFKNNQSKVIVSIEPGEEMVMVDIETSEKTFIAEGLVSHNSATPALDQFGKDGFIYAPSSPWAKTGKFFENWELAIEMEDGKPSYPERMMLQLPSWGPYEDWEEADHLPLKPPTKTIIEVEVEVKKRKQVKVDGKTKRRTVTVIETQQIEQLVPGPTFRRIKSPIQVFDDDMRQLERANPDAFAVERRSHWAQSLNAYLNPKMVERMFQPWEGKTLFIQRKGRLDRTYVAHGDPANTNKRFGWSIAHRVWVPDEDEDRAASGEGMYHVVFDKIWCWDPADYEDHILDYEDVMGDIKDDVKIFIPEDVSFDQFNVPATIGVLRKFVSKASLPKQVNVREVSRTAPLNWRHSELFKSALNMGLVHAPMLTQDLDDDGGHKINYASSEAELELKFLEEKNGKVKPPDTGPVQTKDIADTIFECTVTLIGKQMATFLGMEFEEIGLSGMADRGTDPYRNTTANRMGEKLTAATARPSAGAARSRVPESGRGRQGMRRR